MTEIEDAEAVLARRLAAEFTGQIALIGTLKPIQVRRLLERVRADVPAGTRAAALDAVSSAKRNREMT